MGLTGNKIPNLNNVIKERHVDWGSGETQVNAGDVPIADAGSYFTGTEIESALQELGLSNSKLNPEKVVTISPTGADYTTIQAALTANATANTMFVVYPGTYTNDTIVFTANNQYVVLAHNVAPKVVEITNSTTICNYGGFTGCIVKDIKMVMTVSGASELSVIDGDAGGSCNFKHCHTELAASGTNDGGASSGCKCIQGHGTIVVVDGSIISNDDQDRGGKGKKTILIETTSFVTLRNVTVTVTGTLDSSSHAVVRDNSDSGDLLIDNCTVTITDNTTTITYGLNIDEGDGEPEVTRNNIHVYNSTGNATTIRIGSTGTLSVRSMFNHYHAVAGSGTALILKIDDANCTAISQFDDLIAVTISDIAVGGIFTYLNSEGDGCLTASTSITATTITDGIATLIGGVLSGVTLGSDLDANYKNITNVNTIEMNAAVDQPYIIFANDDGEALAQLTSPVLNVLSFRNINDDGYAIIRVSTPTDNDDAVTKSYADGLLTTHISNADDHTQYLLADGTRAMAGTLDLNGNSINTGNNVIVQAELDQIAAIGAVTISATQWGYLGALNQPLASTDSPSFAGLTVNGNMSVTGKLTTVDTEQILVEGPIIFTNQEEVGAGITFGKGGSVIGRGSEPDVGIIFDESDDTYRVGEYLVDIGDVVSATAEAAVLDTNSSAVDDAYNGKVLRVFKEGETTQLRTVTDYVGLTKTVTVATWDVIPDNTWSYYIEQTDDTVAIAAREDTPTDTGVAFWDTGTHTFKTHSNLVWSGTDLSINGTTLAATYAAIADKYTDAKVEAVIDAEVLPGQSIDNAIDSLILSHKGDDEAHHALVTVSAPIVLTGQAIELQNEDAGTISQIDTDGTLTDNSDLYLVSEKAIKTYADTKATAAESVAAVLLSDTYLLNNANDSSNSVITALGFVAGASGIDAGSYDIINVNDIFLTNPNSTIKYDGTFLCNYWDGTNGYPAFIIEAFNQAHFYVNLQLEGMTLTEVGSITLGAKSTPAGATVSAINDTDAMTENSATALATQQSIKAYVDNNLHTILTVPGTTPLSLSTQALTLVNDKAGVITQIDTSLLSNLDTDIPTSKAVTTALSGYLSLSGGSMTGDMSMHGHDIQNVGAFCVEFTVGIDGIVAGELLYIDDGVIGTAGHVYKADASGTNTYPCIGIAMESGDDGDKINVCIGGIYKAGIPISGAAVGDKIYMSGTTAGAMVTAAPTTSEHIYQCIGIVISITEILVKDMTWMEVA